MTKTPLQSFFRERGVPLRELAPDAVTPARFSDTAAEHLATRRSCGLFDFSFMGCIEVAGPGSRAFLHYLQTRDLSRLGEGRLAYTLLLRPDGTVLNDATVWRLGNERYYLFVGHRTDIAYVRSLAARYPVSFVDRSAELAIIAVQGKHAWATIVRCVTRAPTALPYYAFTVARFGGADCWVGRLGYSGETGYELIIDVGLGTVLWRALMDAGAAYGIAECGFDAADSLRIEAGHILFSRELLSPVTPFELGFTRLLDFYREPAIGMAVLRDQRWHESRQRLVGLLIDEDSARPVVATESGSTPPVEGIARVTSVCRSPVFRRLLGLGFVSPADRYPGTRVRLAGRGRSRVARLPFYDPARFLARRVP